MRLGCQHSWVLGESSLPGSQPANHFHIVWLHSSHVRGGWRERKSKREEEGERERMLSYVSTYKGINLIVRALCS